MSIYTKEQLDYLEEYKRKNPLKYANITKRVSYTPEEDASAFRKIQYGFDKSSWLGGNVYRYLAAGGDKELLKEREEERLRELDEEYKDLSSKEKGSGWAIAGEVGGTLLDPTVIPLSFAAGAGLAAKTAHLGNTTRRLLNATTQGSISAGDYAVYELAKGNDIDPIALTASASIGGLVGGLLSPKSLKLTDEAVSKRTVKTIEGKELESASQKRKLISEVSEEEQKTLDEIINDYYKAKPDSIGDIVDSPANGYKVTAAKTIQELYKNQKELRKNYRQRFFVDPKDPAIKDLMTEEEAAKKVTLGIRKTGKRRGEKAIKHSIDESEKFPIYKSQIPSGPLTQEKAAKLKELQKSGTYMNDVDFIKLKNARDEVVPFLRTGIADLIDKQSEDISDVVIGTAGALRLKGMLNKNTIGQAVYRPLIGSIAGFGIGATTSLYSDEEFNPIPWMIMGAGAGYISKKINNAKFITKEVKDEATGTVDTVIRSGFWDLAKASVFFSGSASSKAKSFGGYVEVLDKSLFQQIGTGLKGASRVTVEEASELMKQDINLKWLSILEKKGLAGGGRAEEIRKAATMFAEGFKDEAELKVLFPDVKDMNKIKELAEEGMRIVDDVSNEVSVVGIKWKPNINPETGKIDYKLPQSHDTLKMATDKDAYKIYKEAYKLEKESQALASLAPGESLDKIKINYKGFDNWFDNMVTYGNGGQAPTSSFKGKRLRPLASHFEKERFFRSFEARKLLAENDFLITDMDQVLKQYVNKTVPITEFARRYGANGEGIHAIRKGINDDFSRAMSNSASDKERRRLVKLRDRHLDTANEMVEVYFGNVHGNSWAANNKTANAVMAVMVTGANLAYLPKVTISSLGELAQPFMNSGAFNSMKGLGRSLNKEIDISRKTGFANRDILSHELRQYAINTRNPNSRIQRGATKVNELFFRFNGLAPFTSFTRRYAYNSGVERAFEIANKISKKRTTSLQNQANAAGLKDSDVGILNNFKSVDEALEDVDGRRILNLAGSRAADRDAIIPMYSNRRAWAQSKDPFVRSLFQFLSWAQAKTSQTNALISRMEDGDHALFAKMLGTLALYDGIVTFKMFLNDPTAEWLGERDEDTYQEAYTTLKNIGAGVQHSGNFNHVLIDKAARLMSSHGGQHPLESLVPVVGWSTEMFEGISPLTGDFEGSIAKNLRAGDTEGALKQTLKRMPAGNEILDFLSMIGMPIEDRANVKKRKGKTSFIPVGGRYYSKGGVVEDVPQVPKEPDERIDKLTGRPYNEQAGTAFIDEEDPVRRLGFLGGGLAENPIRRLGFTKGSLVPPGRVKYALGRLVGRAVSRAMTRKSQELPIDEIIGKNTDEVIAMHRRQYSSIPDEVIEEAPVAKADESNWELFGVTEEKVKAWRATKGSTEPAPNPELENAARQLADDTIPVEARRQNFINVLEGKDSDGNVVSKPLIRDWDIDSVEDLVRELPTNEEILMSVGKKGNREDISIIGVNDSLRTGDITEFRLDVPAYRKYNIWTLAAHKPVEGKSIGKVVAYGKTGRLKNVSFKADMPEETWLIAAGEQDKFPMATMKGEWVEHDPEELAKEALELLKDPDSGWVQIGFNPKNNSQFYVRDTGKLLESSEEIIQIGGFVIAKKPKVLDVTPVFRTKKSRTLKDGTIIKAGTLIPFNKGGKVYKALRKRKAEGGLEDDENTRQSFGDTAFRLKLLEKELLNKKIKPDSAEASRDRKMIRAYRMAQQQAEIKANSPYFTNNDRRQLEKFQRLIGPPIEYTPEQLKQKEQYTNEYLKPRDRKAEGGSTDDENTRQSFRDTAFRMKILGESLRKEDYVKNQEDIRSYRFIQQQAEQASRRPHYTSNEREVAEQWSKVGPTREYTPEELKQKEQYTNKYLMPRNRKAEGGYTTESGTLEPEEAIKFTMKTYFPEDKPHVVDYLINQAQVESRLGEDKNTYNIRTSSYVDGSTMRGGFGIHQIDEIAFEDVKNRLIGGEGVPSGIKKYGAMVKEVFDKENLKDIEYEDLRDPVNNTIFSRLIHKTKPDPIPEDIEGQAKYWTDNYNKSAIPKIAERRGISVQKVMESMGSNTEIQKAVDDFRKELNEKFIERSKRKRLNKNSGGKVISSLHKRIASL